MPMAGQTAPKTIVAAVTLGCFPWAVGRGTPPPAE
jgi:hypothetical protein